MILNRGGRVRVLSHPRGVMRGVPVTPTYRLLRQTAPPVAAPVLDAAQQAVVDHERGPLLVLAGPGTGKTTTLVEAVLPRRAPRLPPAPVVLLTLPRQAA